MSNRGTYTFFGPTFRAAIVGLLAAGLTVSPALALVTLNDGHDRIFVTATLGVSHDSNVFASNGSPGDFLYSTGFSADYQRRAGWIGVNANMAISGGRYGSLKGQDFSDPTFSVELNKRTGRTTGAITLSAVRESRADAAINTRSSSWNYSWGANFRYHIAGSNDLAGNFGYSQRKYSDTVAFANLTTFSSNIDFFHVFSSERDLILGYRYRYSDTSRDTSSTDHGFSAGVHGKIIKGINGTLRAGYQIRVPHGPTTTLGSGSGQFSSWTAMGSASYSINKKIRLNASISKDFSTTATDASVDGLVSSLDLEWALTSHWSFNASAGWGVSKFLGNGSRPVLDPGPPPVLGSEREDSFVNANLGMGYSLNEHLKLSLSYLWFKNASSITFADFVRNSWSFSMSSRW